MLSTARHSAPSAAASTISRRKSAQYSAYTPGAYTWLAKLQKLHLLRQNGTARYNPSGGTIDWRGPQRGSATRPACARAGSGDPAPRTGAAPPRSGSMLGERVRALGAVEGEPGMGRLQAAVDGFDIGLAFGAQPLLERFPALPGVDGDAVLPGGAATEHAGERHARFGRQRQALVELGVADAGAQEDERT